MNTTGLLDGLLARGDADGRYYGVVVGVVTNNRDPENLHRVRVRFPWLNNDDESNWARVASPGAGKDRGLYFLPEVDDEVLVAFEHGCVEHPFVIGALWNGRDAAHESNADGANDQRSLKSRSGHVIRLCDRAGHETIEIVDKTGNNKMVFSAADNSIAIEAQGDIRLSSRTGKVSIDGLNVELTGTANVKVKSALIDLN